MVSLKHQKGSGLIEVLIAGILMVAGISYTLALTITQRQTMEALAIRKTAMRLVKEKQADLYLHANGRISDLRAFMDISGNQGGTLPAGEHLLTTKSKQMVVPFTLSWSVTPLYLNSEQLTLQPVLDGLPYPLVKRVTISVSWSYQTKIRTIKAQQTLKHPLLLADPNLFFLLGRISP